MKTLQIDENKARVLYKSAIPEFKIMLEDSFGKDFFSEKITDRVKTYEDACRILGLHSYSELPYEDPKTKDQEAINAYAKIFIIARALNEGWVPDWKNSSQYKYYPWFDLSAGSGFSYYGYGDSLAGTSVGSRLCYKSRELAEYAGKQFLAIYKEAFTL